MIIMKTQLKLSKRLETIYDMVSFNNVVADIGSDHALLPIALVLNGKVTRAYASEVNEGPYDMSVKNIEKYGLSNYIEPVLSDGRVLQRRRVIALSVATLQSQTCSTIRQVCHRMWAFQDSWRVLSSMVIHCR